MWHLNDRMLSVTDAGRGVYLDHLKNGGAPFLLVGCSAIQDKGLLRLAVGIHLGSPAHLQEEGHLTIGEDPDLSPLVGHLRPYGVEYDLLFIVTHLYLHGEGHHHRFNILGRHHQFVVVDLLHLSGGVGLLHLFGGVDLLH